MKRHLLLLTGIAMLGIVFFHGTPAGAMPPFFKEFQKKYIEGNPNTEQAATLKKTKCFVCHVKGQKKKVRNRYGSALDKLLDKENFKKERLKAEPEKVKQEIVDALNAVADTRSDADNEQSHTFGELLAQGKLPGGEATAATTPAKAEADAETKAEVQASPKTATPVAAAPQAKLDSAQLMAAMLAELKAEIKAELKAELLAELGGRLSASRLAGKDAPAAAALVAVDPVAEKAAIAAIEAIGGAVRQIALNDDSKDIDFHLDGTSLTDEGLAQVKAIGRVAHLHLKDTQITDAGLAHIAGLSTLERLHLEQTKVTDAGLAHLQGLAGLEYLNLYGTQVSDAGLAQLAPLKNLKKVYIWQTKVTIEGVKKLKAAIPGIQVIPDLEVEQQKAEAAAEKEDETKKDDEEKVAEK